MKKTIRIGFIAFFASTIISGCSQWLDVKPNNVVNEDEIFTDRKGFQSALAGVYYDLTLAPLYGRELNFGFMDAMVGYYDISSNSHRYIEATHFNYTHATIKGIIDEIWGGLYKGVNSINIILENVDNIKDDPNYDLIKGEALGLRAYLHLEALKYFGPVVKVDGLNTQAIPYYDQVQDQAQKPLTTEAVLEHIESDLQEALVLLESDPIITIGRTEDGNVDPLDYNSLVERRGIHMNYYTVLALLARKSQWEGNKQEAYTRAKRVVDELKETNAIHLIGPQDLQSLYQKDLRFSVENIWGLYINDFKSTSTLYLPDLQESAHVAYGLIPEYDYLKTNLYDQSESGSANDFRLLYWFGSTGSSDRFLKLLVNEDLVDFESQYEATMVSLAEMYYIMAEAKVDTDPQGALDILNELRLSRNLIEPITYNENMTSEKLLQYIVDEARKQSIGEGYMFALYKRLYWDIPTKSTLTPASKSIYMFPVPVDELIYNPQY